jgi:CBS domain-containing protein
MPQRPIRNVIARQKILTSHASTTVREAAKAMKERNVSSVLIVDAGRLVGIFTERDAVSRVLAAGRDANATKLGDVMTRNPKTIGPEKPVGHALLMMYEGGFRHVPVVDKGHPVGLISARDALGPELQEFESELERRKRIGEILG